MTLTVNLFGDPAQNLEEARKRLIGDGQPAEINAPLADTQLVVVCVSLDVGPTQPLVDLTQTPARGAEKRQLRCVVGCPGHRRYGSVGSPSVLGV